MYSPRPPETGETPTKIVFEGVDPGSAEAQLLYVQTLGAISQFQGKARQQRVLSGNDAHYVHQALPDGQGMRYTYNNGQETIHVRLNPGTIKELTQPRQYKPLPCDYLLAIDVLFDPAQFVVGDIYSKKPYTVTTPGQPLYPNDPQYYDYELIASRPADHDNITPGFYLREDSNVKYPSTGGYFETTFTIESNRIYTNGVGPGYADLNSPQHAFDVLANDTSPTAGTTIYRYTITAYGGYYDNRDYVFFGSEHAPYSSFTAVETYQPGPYNGPLGPPTTSTAYHDFRERRTYLDVLPVVGLRVTASDGTSYTALSTGRHDDPRLVALTDNEQTAIQRSIAFAHPEGGDHFVGAGFLAKLLAPWQDGVPPDKVRIEVYLASTNISQKNSAPGEESSAFGTDEDDMTYAVTPTVKYMLQVRELADTPGYVVRVVVDAEGKVEKFGPDDLDNPTSTEMLSAARHVDWRFAAQGDKWADTGGEPAVPTAPAMGKLLASSTADAQINVVPTDALARQVLTAPAWNGDVTNMTQVATITWTPPTICHSHGTATIDGESAPAPPWGPLPVGGA